MFNVSPNVSSLLCISDNVTVVLQFTLYVSFRILRCYISFVVIVVSVEHSSIKAIFFVLNWKLCSVFTELR